MDVAIVGAGIIGCAIAHELTARGAACTVVDDRPAGGGATQASAGMLAPYVEAHERGPLLDLGVRSLELYDAWIDRVSRDAAMPVEYRRVGTLEVALDPQHAEELRARAAAGAGTESAWLDGPAARARHPGLGTVAGALHTPVHGYVSAHGVTTALAHAARMRGCTFIASRATRIAPHADGMRVTTTTGDVDAMHVVLAAGAWTSAIDIDGAPPPPLRPVRGQLLYLGWRARPIDTILWGPECYLVPRLDGSVLVGATAEDAGFDERATAAGVRDLLDAACELLPAGWGASFLGARVGLRPATPDALPIIGPDPRVPGLVHASGHFRNGVLLAPVTARIVADWLTDEKRDECFVALSVERFRKGQG